MAEFKAVINDTKTGKSYQVAITGQNYNSFIGKKIGDEVDGVFVSLPGYKLQITGGSDITGFPMRNDMPGAAKRRVIVSDSTGFHPSHAGQRRKKTFRGNTVGPDTVQINLRIVKHGSKAIEDLVPKKEDKK